MNKYQIAVVTPVYNGEKTIQRSIDSLLAQTFDNWICVIVNDGSTDNTLRVLEKYSNDGRFHIINFNKNRGRGYARDIALRYIREQNIPYMCMLDADDLYYSDKLQWQYDYMESNPNITLASSSLGLIDSDLNLIGVQGGITEEKYIFNKYEYYKSVPHASSIIRVINTEEHGFDEELLLGEDKDFMRRILINKEYVFIPRVSYLYSREGSFSFEKYKKSKMYSLLSLKKTGVSNTFIIKSNLSSKMKVFYIWILIKTGKLDLYLKYNISRTPTREELEKHREQMI